MLTSEVYSSNYGLVNCEPENSFESILNKKTISQFKGPENFKDVALISIKKLLTEEIKATLFT
jgi:hypothetical protein